MNSLSSKEMTLRSWSFLCADCGYGREYRAEWEVQVAAQNHRDDTAHTTLIHAGPLADLTKPIRQELNNGLYSTI